MTKAGYTGVALSGRAGAGKSTVAAIVAEQLGFSVGSFAAALKADLASLRCVKGDPGFREVAIAYGTTHKRALDPDYWIDRLRGPAGTLAWLVIDDMRMENELAAVKADGLLTVRLDVPAWVRAARLGLEADDPFVRSTHESEAALDTAVCDLLIPYGNTPEAVADMIVAKFKAGPV